MIWQGLSNLFSRNKCFLNQAAIGQKALRKYNISQPEILARRKLIFLAKAQSPRFFIRVIPQGFVFSHNAWASFREIISRIMPSLELEKICAFQLPLEQAR